MPGADPGWWRSPAVGRRSLRLVVEDRLDLGEDLGRELRDDVEGTEVGRDLLGLGSAAACSESALAHSTKPNRDVQDDGRDVRVLDAPREREAGLGAVEALCELAERADLCDLGLADGALELL